MAFLINHSKSSRVDLSFSTVSLFSSLGLTNKVTVLKLFASSVDTSPVFTFLRVK